MLFGLGMESPSFLARKCLGYKFHINSVAIQITWSIFLDFFQNKIIDDEFRDGALWSMQIMQIGFFQCIFYQYSNI